jgi:hypothetical protein
MYMTVFRRSEQHANTVRHYYPVRSFGELRDIRALPTIPYGLDEGQNTRPARFKTKDVRFGQKQTFVVQKACPLYPQERTIWRVGRSDWVFRENTLNCLGLRGENFVCSCTPSATTTFDGLR